MSPLEAARHLTEHACPIDDRDECWYCEGDGYPGVIVHAPDCPWLALSQIVVALEAALRIAENDPPSRMVCTADEPFRALRRLFGLKP